MNGWDGADGVVGRKVVAASRESLDAYRAKPILVEQDAGIEISNVEGGYGRKQIHELVQNGADAMRDSPGRITIVRTRTHLYCANEGAPLDERGVDALMASHIGTKRDDQIGRFGLGFKSVLGISVSPEIFSRSGSFRFDGARNAALIRQVVPTARRTPVLRLAQPLDPAAEVAEDEVLANLCTWATTVVRLPLDADIDWLGDELASFPGEFLLFAEHVLGLELRDDVADFHRAWSAGREGSAVVLRSGKTEVAWNIFKATHRSSPEARQDAGEIAGRDRVDLTWAIPRSRRTAIGQFWAYFPTASQTTLSGIVNAPFRTNEDRHDILDGVYNRELLVRVLPMLLASALPELVDDDDPGSIFDILPARGRESRSWADEALNEPVMRAVSMTSCVPDADGHLGRLADVNLTPAFVAEHGRWSDLWSAVPNSPTNWLHPSVGLRPERRAKAVRLYSMAKIEEATTRVWLQECARSGIEGSRTAVQLAALINRSEPDHVLEMRRSLVVRRADGSLATPTVGKIFLPADPGETGPEFVAPELADDPETLLALKELGIRPLDAAGRLNAQIAQMAAGPVKGMQVERLWVLVRALGRGDAVPLLERGFGRGGTPVRTLAAKARPVRSCLMPGSVVPGDGARDADAAIDIRFHALDHEILADLGAVSGPRLGKPRADEKWFEEWRSHAQAKYLDRARAEGYRISPASVVERPGRTTVGLDVLGRLSPAGRAAFTAEALALTTEEWSVFAESRGAAPAVRVVNPAVWSLRKHGAVTTSFGIRSVSDALAPQSDLPDRVLPVVTGLDAAQVSALGIATAIDPGDWKDLLADCEKNVQVADLPLLYSAAARHGAPRPQTIRVPRDGGYDEVPTTSVVVTSDDVAHTLLVHGHDVLCVPEESDAAVLIDRWRLGDARTLLSRTVLRAVSGDPVPALDRFPGLRVTASDRIPDVELVPCSELAIEVVTSDGGPSSVIDRQTVWDQGTYWFRDDLDDERLLRALDRDIRLGLDGTRVRQTLEIGDRRKASTAVLEVRKAGTTEEKLLALVGEDEVRRLVPTDAIRTAEERKGRSLLPTEVAAMAERVAGGQLLKKLTPAMEKRGITVPTQWTGGDRATAFTRDLGLPESYAGSKENSRPAVEKAHGPVRLPHLHDYQSAAISKIRETLGSSGSNRGLVALPTGSGKTRVAVEALIDYIREHDGEAVVVWIAQSDELCEQAVETWMYLWRAVGTHETQLTVNRLWGSNSASQVQNGAQIVVATDDKLLSLAKRGDHDWLREATVVVVDEAHTSVSPTYTEIFRWLGRGARERSKPLIGLSATPFRGTNEDQTKLLVNRYDANLLTKDLFGERDPHEALQEMGILAKVRHEVLEGMELKPIGRTDADSDRFTMLESRIDMSQVAADDARNARILDSIVALNQDLTVLLFAASVLHAEQLAAVLTTEGVPAASISAYTPAAERRQRVREFQAGDLRVITNFNVLSQGFDAPSVGAVYVARPTFSPNRYQQMIGRGLRGPRNGGSEEVLIVNVKDNMDAFGEQLAFHHFDALWGNRW